MVRALAVPRASSRRRCSASLPARLSFSEALRAVVEHGEVWRAQGDAGVTDPESLRAAVKSDLGQLRRVLCDMGTSLRMVCGGPSLASVRVGVRVQKSVLRGEGAEGIKKALVEDVQSCAARVVDLCHSWFLERLFFDRGWTVTRYGGSWWVFSLTRIPVTHHVTLESVPDVVVRPKDFPRRVPLDVRRLLETAERTPLALDLRIVEGTVIRDSREYSALFSPDPFLVLKIGELMVGLKRWGDGALRGVPACAPFRSAHGLPGRVLALLRNALASARAFA